MDIILLVVSVASLVTNIWLVRKYNNTKFETVTRVVEIQRPEEPDPVAQVEPDPVSVKVDSPKVQAWVNQSGIPMVASRSLPNAPQQAPRSAPLARPYGFAGGPPGGQDF